MSWEMHEAAKKIADGWYSELEAGRKRNAVLGRENAKLRDGANAMRQLYEDELKHALADNAKLRDENKELREFAEMMLLVCKNQGIVGGVFTCPDRNSNIDEYVDFERRARELGVDE